LDTRWKNIVKKICTNNREEWLRVLKMALLLTGIVILMSMVLYRNSHTTGEALVIGTAGNIFLAPGMAFLLRSSLSRRYRELAGQSDFDYEKWKRSETDSMRRLYQLGAAACLAAVWYLYYLVYQNGVWGGWGRGWYYNFATGYVMMITVLIQLLAAQNIVRKFWKERLDVVMDRKDELLRIRVEEALEIERKSLEKVSRSDQLRVDLITNVSHDLKTPLTSMVGYIELIKKEELSDVVRDYVDVISARTEKLKEMINSLFSLAKASSGNVELNKEFFEVNRLIEQIFADMDDRVKESGLKFVMQLTEEDTKICSDNSYFYRICQNLVENALKYSAQGTRVFVRTYVKEPASGRDDRSDKEKLTGAGRKICIEITNTAGYFMDFTKDDIVERFARADRERTSEGNGLGLAIVSTYAKALGGDFDIRIDCDQFKACLEMEQENVVGRISGDGNEQD